MCTGKLPSIFRISEPRKGPKGWNLQKKKRFHPLIPVFSSKAWTIKSIRFASRGPPSKKRTKKKFLESYFWLAGKRRVSDDRIRMIPLRRWKKRKNTKKKREGKESVKENNHLPGEKRRRQDVYHSESSEEKKKRISVPPHRCRACSILLGTLKGRGK